MPTLHDYQAAFVGYLRSAAGAAVPPALEREIDAGTGARHAGLAVYRNNVAMRLIDALEAAYPAVLRLVGQDFFRFAATEYIRQHPPRSRTLLSYGDAFAEFIAGFEPAESVPYLKDVARLETLYLDAYHAEEADCLTSDLVGDLSQLSQAGGGLHLHPSARLMMSPYPVSRIWEVNRAEPDLRGDIEIAGETEFLLVIRPEAQVEVRRLPIGAYWMLVMLESGLSLAQAMKAGADIEPGRDIERDLESLIAGGTFCGFTPCEAAKQGRIRPGEISK